MTASNSKRLTCPWFVVQRTRFDPVARTPLGADQTVLATGVVTSSGTGLSTAAAHGFPSGAIIAGRYRVVALLGRGRMGEVYRADDLTLDRPVALKFLPASAAMNEAHLGQLHHAPRTARQIAHKNVCRLYDPGEADGRRFLTMEYVDGADRASLLRRIGTHPVGQGRADRPSALRRHCRGDTSLNSITGTVPTHLSPTVDAASTPARQATPTLQPASRD